MADISGVQSNPQQQGFGATSPLRPAGGASTVSGRTAPSNAASGEAPTRKPESAGMSRPFKSDLSSPGMDQRAAQNKAAIFANRK